MSAESVDKGEAERDALAPFLAERSWTGRRKSIDISPPAPVMLAFLWSESGKDAAPFVGFWRTIGNDDELLRFRSADMHLRAIYAALGAARDEEASHAIWSEVHGKRPIRAVCGKADRQLPPQ